MPDESVTFYRQTVKGRRKNGTDNCYRQLMAWPRVKSITASLLWGASIVRAAVNLDGIQAVAPSGEGASSPISDPRIYIPDQHDCPPPCAVYSNVHSSVCRLLQCAQLDYLLLVC